MCSWVLAFLQWTAWRLSGMIASLWFFCINERYWLLFNILLERGSPKYVIGNWDALHWRVRARLLVSWLVAAVRRNYNFSKLTLKPESSWKICNVIFRNRACCSVGFMINKVSSAKSRHSTTRERCLQKIWSPQFCPPCNQKLLHCNR